MVSICNTRVSQVLGKETLLAFFIFYDKSTDISKKKNDSFYPYGYVSRYT